MKIIKQSFEILPEWDDPIKQIAERARICYKSEDKAKEDETDFVKGIIKHGHNSCLEMFVEHIYLEDYDEIDFLKLSENKYLNVSECSKGILISGSIRAFREFILANNKEKESFSNRILHHFLNHPKEKETELKNPFNTLFNDLPKTKFEFPTMVNVKLELEENIDHDTYFKHHHVAVKFITNRAVTHELVRHRPLAFLQESQRYCRYSDNKFGNEVTFIEPTAFDFSHVDTAIWKQCMIDTEAYYMALLKGGLSPQAARTVLPNSCKTEIIAYASLREWSHIFALRTSDKAEPSMREAMIPVWNKFKEMFPDIPEIQNPERSVG